MSFLPELEQIRDDMMAQKTIYHPTSFWEGAALAIENDLLRFGIERFRSVQSALSYFVPTYGSPGSGFSSDQTEILLRVITKDLPKSTKTLLALEQFLTGESAALADYRVLQAADSKDEGLSLNGFSESTYGTPVEQFIFDSNLYSRSSLNYLLGLSFLKKHIKGAHISTVLEIGGGFGTLGEILLGDGRNKLRYVDVDIPPTSYVAERYLKEVLGQTAVAGYADTRDLSEISISDLPSASVLNSWQIEKVTGEIDLFVNFISFQEMEPDVVKNYLSHVDRLKSKWILLRNMREGKQVKTDSNKVGVEQPLKTYDYLQMLDGYDLVDTNVNPFGFKTVDGFHSEILLLKRHDG